LVLRDIQAMTASAPEQEQEFVSKLANRRAKEANAQLRTIKSEHTRIQKRLAELDVIIPRTFEASDLG
jgi:hypothetical protein